jgi:hypothetical protein
MTLTTHDIEETMQMVEYLAMKNIITEAGPKMFATTAKHQ